MSSLSAILLKMVTSLVAAVEIISIGYPGAPVTFRLQCSSRVLVPRTANTWHRINTRITPASRDMHLLLVRPLVKECRIPSGRYVPERHAALHFYL